ncbi:peptidase T [Hujiaoplasma nucleasis]|uniref:Peptidase T n=1 Tax=Hujiaoplasma nucleasis TaxID=2725268 RepID=A0A7L6N5W3_9MOLU|nr:peptidase T [Hujiaoplasma nucleasis]QLY40892.1 peptidase T [Hujiaoplasma nucleasis]
MELLERFLKYVTYDTQSDSNSKTYPSTDKQLILLKDLLKELNQMGIKADMDQYGYVIGRIPSNLDKLVPSLALIAHVDTSPDASGKNVKAKIIKAYQGGRLLLNEEKEIYLDPKQFPNLLDKIDDDLIVTDGTTLLGADDKLGVAEIMTIAEELQEHPEIKHGDIVIVFTPDEEVGTGTEFIDIKKINADFAFTLDGSKVGEIAYENFNAASAHLTFYGRSVHPGSAKNKLINSLDIANEFYGLLPKNLKAELTEDYEGFNHLVSQSGTVEKTTMMMIIRNHDKLLFDKQKADFLNIQNFINKKYGFHACDLQIKDSYYNMVEILKNHQSKINIAIEAIKEHGFEPIIEPIRGGTDGARLSFMGLPCPNLGTGGYNFHGPFEYASVKEMYMAKEIVKSIIYKFTQL